MSKKKQPNPRKMFVLNTDVFLMDPDSFKLMGEHDVVIPFQVVEELQRRSKNKNDPFAENAKQSINGLNDYFKPDLYKDGVSLGPGKGKISVLVVEKIHPTVKSRCSEDSPDKRVENRILSAALYMKEKANREARKNSQKGRQVEPKTVVFVTNDNALTQKAGAVGIFDVERYRNNTIKSHYSGMETICLNAELVAQMFTDGKVSWENVAKFLGNKTPEPYPYEFFIIPGGEKKTFSYFLDGFLYPITNGEKIYGSVSTRNNEQQLSMNALLNPDVSLVTLSGPAGTGKTLLAIGAAMQLVNKSDTPYNQLLITKKIIALDNNSDGYLPGDMIEKVQPYMQSLYDNVNFLKSACRADDKAKIERLLSDSSRFSITPLAYIRGRTFANTILVVDESQNLTENEIKAIVTRMGEHSKVFFTGDVRQIDSTILTYDNNGLTHLIEKAKTYDHAAHVELEKGERSALSDWAGTHL